MKRRINPNDSRLSAEPTSLPLAPSSNPADLSPHCVSPALFSPSSQLKPSATAKTARPSPTSTTVRHVAKPSSALFFRYNPSLGPPYQLLIDTNFLNFSIQNKLDVIKSSMDCLLAKTIPCVTDCVLAELEKLGPKYRIALRLARDPRFTRLHCVHEGTYADDCLVRRVEQHKCYIVATCDRDLKRRIRKIPGVPIMYITKHQYSIERFADVNAAPRE